jgi:hypothetical protein
MKDDDYPSNIFNLRDFVYFFRILARNDKISIFSPENIFYSLQRNFSGVSKKNFKLIVDHFFNQIKLKTSLLNYSRKKIKK